MFSTCEVEASGKLPSMPSASYYDFQLLVQILGAFGTLLAVIVALVFGVRNVRNESRTRERESLERARQIVVEFVPGQQGARRPGFVIANGSQQAITDVHLRVVFEPLVLNSGFGRKEAYWEWDSTAADGYFGYVLGGDTKVRCGVARPGPQPPEFVEVTSDQRAAATAEFDLRRLTRYEMVLTVDWQDGSGERWRRRNNHEPERGVAWFRLQQKGSARRRSRTRGGGLAKNNSRGGGPHS